MPEFQTTSRNQVRQISSRGHYDRETVYRIVDQAPVCHVGFAVGEQPYVIPTLHARQGDELLLHGAPGSRLIRHVQAGHPVCVSFALLNGWVLGKAACSHSMNYRSVVLFGRGRLVEPPEDKLRAFERFTEQMMPGRWAEVRPPNEKELAATAIVAIQIEEASAKVRDGSARDSQPDRELPTWAGVVPVRMAVGTPVAADYTQDDTPPPESVRAYLLSLRAAAPGGKAILDGHTCPQT
jgi:nitroimidazol reductase NimA-like FMN-containing flavoprotein (pyridoxamine 5'-phosphate oxidase superfamily)